MKEILVLVSIVVYLSGSFGLLFRQLDRGVNTEIILHEEDFIPSVLLVLMLGGVGGALLCYFLYSNDELMWAISITVILVIISIEYILYSHRDALKMIYGLLSTKIIALVMGVIVYFYFDSIVSSFLANLTGVSPIVFNQVVDVIVFFLSVSLWLLLVQVTMLILLVAVHMKSSSKKGNYNITEAFYATVFLLVSFFAILFSSAIMKDLIELFFNEYFVKYTYYSNKLNGGGLMCNNLLEHEEVLLLPSGEVSIARLDDNNNYIFYISGCDQGNRAIVDK
ncbi:hypothetical protein [Cobetia marina]|uniref:hypothetical protein n=1 Tax=Cobetia marina TaxID=28258 RepID=UPI00114454D5|nr:hypothetical protein [Cobetia marina]GED43207.1 hypothetical protein HHA02_25360 [Cobetia marina]